MVLYEEWFDKVGLIHLDRYPDVTNSENGPLFSAYFHILHKNKKCNHPFLLRSIGAVQPAPHVFKPSANGGTHFSHDNMTGLYCMYYMAFRSVPSHLPLTHKHVKHPRDILFYMYCHTLKYGGFLVKLLQHILLAFPCLAMVISCLRKYERDGTTKATSTKLLAFLRCKTFGLNKTFRLCSYILNKSGLYTSWGDVFEFYFKHPEHPCRSMSAYGFEL
jgi:hypothetical protein